MIQTNAFDYINVLNRAADAAWQRNEAISNNIANVDTPGYKRQDVAFESVLQQALGNNRYQSMDDKVANVNLSRLRGRAYVDYANYSYRLDGNNVDIENENVMLAVGGGYLFGVHWAWGLCGMWVAFLLDENIRGIIFVRRWYSMKWVHKSFVQA